MTLRANPPTRSAIPRCPVCGKLATTARLLPFCSARCADVDLGRWLTGQYRITGPAVEDEAPGDPQPDGSA